jgi:bifunctional DNA-binding transcriptional regulator/antitoxin component of YhaV-PrlF toxin-antitoxin module
MARQRIIISDAGATLVIAPEVVSALGLKNGDEVDIVVMDRSVVLRPLDELERAKKLDAVTQAVLQRRKRALQQLTDEPAS